MPIEVVMPALGITVEKGIVVEWLKQEGEAVSKGEVLFVVETDKVTTEVESPASGILAKILVPAEVEVPILTVLALITEPGEKLPDQYKVAGYAPTRAEPASFPAEYNGGLSPSATVVAITSRAVPAARKLAKSHGLDLSEMQGTGPDGVILLKDVKSAMADEHKKPKVMASSLARKLAEKESVSVADIEGSGVRGRIMRADIEAYLKKSETEIANLGSFIPMSNVRKIIADRMAQSAFSAPHIYFFSEVWFDPLLRFRKEVLPDFESSYGVRISINDFLIKAVALTIQQFPMLNAQIQNDQIYILPEINIGLAVALPDGLIVPAIEHANSSALSDIARQRDDLVRRARIGKLKLNETERGTFTISSLANYDITHFTAILNPPQSGILSVGKTDEKLVMIDDRVISKRVTCIGISVDHRIIDGAVAAEFLQNLKNKLERPSFTFCSL